MVVQGASTVPGPAVSDGAWRPKRAAEKHAASECSLIDARSATKNSPHAGIFRQGGRPAVVDLCSERNASGEHSCGELGIWLALHSWQHRTNTRRTTR